ncbi:hypothetical protein [uncultured Dokdonia sp.]|uniref:hypothetical protein n=1 Tax=uncultured Dokdonia sp. TaxID=575653 RepID=UPI002631BB47|nr:hypothetical protein [uncultured Dokdonia sp.]
MIQRYTIDKILRYNPVDNYTLYAFAKAKTACNQINTTPIHIPIEKSKNCTSFLSKSLSSSLLIPYICQKICHVQKGNAI